MNPVRIERLVEAIQAHFRERPARRITPDLPPAACAEQSLFAEEGDAWTISPMYRGGQPDDALHLTWSTLLEWTRRGPLYDSVMGEAVELFGAIAAACGRSAPPVVEVSAHDVDDGRAIHERASRENPGTLLVVNDLPPDPGCHTQPEDRARMEFFITAERGAIEIGNHYRVASLASQEPRRDMMNFPLIEAPEDAVVMCIGVERLILALTGLDDIHALEWVAGEDWGGGSVDGFRWPCCARHMDDAMDVVEGIVALPGQGEYWADFDMRIFADTLMQSFTRLPAVGGVPYLLWNSDAALFGKIYLNPFNLRPEFQETFLRCRPGAGAGRRIRRAMMGLVRRQCGAETYFAYDMTACRADHDDSRLEAIMAEDGFRPHGRYWTARL